MSHSADQPVTRPVARRIELPPGPPIDPFALAGQGGMLFSAAGTVRVGLGTALSLDLPSGLDAGRDIDRIMATLAAIEVEDGVTAPDVRRSPGRAVVAFGALPFDRGAPARLVVPHLLYAADADGSAWVTTLSGHPFDLPDDPESVRRWLVEWSHRETSAVQPSEADSPPLIAPRLTDAAFIAMVGEALRVIARGDLAKVVLARQVDVTMPSPVGIADLLRRWQELEPNCTTFSVPTADGQFVGASPELLIERSGADVRSRPLAGTTERRSGDNGSGRPTELLRSWKDGHEHRLVVESIEEALAPLCSTLTMPTGPDLVHLHTITHLGTSLVGTLAPSSDGTLPSALGLVAALHPTPAVGGVPRVEAERLISRLEPEPRGQYAGPVGIVDAGGDGTWMVGIRAISVRGAEARLAAGVGIVAGSEPVAELEETRLKLSAAFEALAPGDTFSTVGPGDSPPVDDAVPLNQPNSAVG